jgi:hypothetical protein
MFERFHKAVARLKYLTLQSLNLASSLLYVLHIPAPVNNAQYVQQSSATQVATEFNFSSEGRRIRKQQHVFQHFAV